MEEGGERNWRRTLDLGREELASSAEVLVLSPLTVGSGASEAQMKPGVERRAGCEMCGVYRGNGESEPPVPAEYTSDILEASEEPVHVWSFEDKSHRL